MSIKDSVIYEVGEENFAILTDLVTSLILGWEARDWLEDHVDAQACVECHTAAITAMTVPGATFGQLRKMLCERAQAAGARMQKARGLIAEWTQPR